MQCSGYAIVQRTQHDLDDYLRASTTKQNLHHLHALRDAAPFLDSARYRGTGRTWLQPFPSLDARIIEAFGDSGCDMNTGQLARRRYREMLGDSEVVPDEDEDLFPDESQAMEVFSLLAARSRYELLYLNRRSFPMRENSLGYDIGYWGGDHYSLIADCFVMPRWHPPQRDLFHILAEQLRSLNSHLLFPTVEAAVSFRAWYRTQDWTAAEGHEAEFEIIQVSAVGVAP